MCPCIAAEDVEKGSTAVKQGQEVLVFIKHYDPRSSKLTLASRGHLHPAMQLSKLVEKLADKLQLDAQRTMVCLAWPVLLQIVMINAGMSECIAFWPCASDLTCHPLTSMLKQSVVTHAQLWEEVRSGPDVWLDELLLKMPLSRMTPQHGDILIVQETLPEVGLLSRRS